jgi:hypothetical protein
VTVYVDVCAYCGTIEAPFHLDHVVPRSRGGPDSPKNLVKACAKCNGAKTDKLPSEWLDVVPPHVAKIEASVSATVEVGARARRGAAARGHLHRAAECGICHTPIVQPPDGRRHWGWVRWWHHRDDPEEQREVVAFALLCTSRKCAQIAGDINRCSDLPVEFVSGKRAVSNLWRLMRDFRWTEKAACDLCDAMHALQFVPTWDNDMPERLGL